MFFFLGRARLPLLVVAIALFSESNLLAQKFPFRVYVAEQGVVARGGPGEAFYSTQELRRGEELTVYRIDDGDWLAIRPPRGSFSLVSANAIADQGNGKGEVIRNGAASRVGSSIHDLQDTVHVRLEKGEWIKILGSQMRDGVKWLRIEPPHGEFRWVHRGDVTTTLIEPTIPGTPDPQDATTVMPLAHNGDRYAAPPLSDQNDATWAARADAPRPLPPPRDGDSPPLAAQPADVPPMSKNDAAASGARAAEPLQAAGDVAAPYPTASSTAENSRVAAGPFGNTVGQSPAQDSPASQDLAFDREMFVMEVVLGQIVAEPTAVWNFGGLEQDAARLLNSASTEQQRDAVRQFAARLNRFSAIRRQHELLPSVDSLLAARKPAPNRVPVAAAPVASNVAQSVREATNPSSDDTRFDALGLLRPVASKRADAPKYALVNDSGQIITFVTPAPDVNLQPYLGRRIGINGTRGYMEAFSHRHVTAGRVMPVGDRIVR